MHPLTNPYKELHTVNAHTHCSRPHTQTQRHMCPEVHPHPFVHPDRRLRTGTKTCCTSRGTHLRTQKHPPLERHTQTDRDKNAHTHTPSQARDKRTPRTRARPGSRSARTVCSGEGGRCSPSALTGCGSAPHFIYLETGRAEAASFA